MEHSFIWLRDMDKLEWKYLESFEVWCWRKMQKIKWTEKVSNEEMLEV